MCILKRQEQSRSLSASSNNNIFASFGISKLLNNLSSKLNQTANDVNKLEIPINNAKCNEDMNGKNNGLNKNNSIAESTNSNSSISTVPTAACKKDCQTRKSSIKGKEFLRPNGSI
jgi:hypothetical protein